MSESPRFFPTTSRTLIAALKAPDAKMRDVSLVRFCSLYYPAIYGYARALGLSVPDAQDRVQDFFVEVVRDELLRKFDSQRGSRLSSWLMKCFRNMESNHYRAQATMKRGGGREFVEFDPEHAEHSY
ncbi:MAG: sigma factor, partial [Prosthecobacter sp.]